MAIARALALQPDILCFDEPTSALDPELTGEVLRVLRALAEQKTTMIIVTHEMHFARDVADRILFMDGGSVVEEGPAHELIDHPREERTRRFLASYAAGTPEIKRRRAPLPRGPFSTARAAGRGVDKTHSLFAGGGAPDGGFDKNA